MAPPVLELYVCMTPNTLKAMFMLGELDLPFEVKHVRVYRGEQFAEGFDRLHPYRKLPVLVDAQGPEGAPFTVFESGAILVYLAEKYGKLLGKGAAERSTVMQWLMLQMSSVGPSFGNASHFTAASGQSETYSRRRFVTQAARLCALYDERLSAERYLAGDAFSIADVATFPWLWRHPGMVRIDTSRFDGLNRWLREVEQRPGLTRAQARYKTLVEADRADLTAIDPDLMDRIMGRGRWWLAEESGGGQ